MKLKKENRINNSVVLVSVMRLTIKFLLKSNDKSVTMLLNGDD